MVLKGAHPTSSMHMQDDVRCMEAENFSLGQRCSSLELQQEKQTKELQQ